MDGDRAYKWANGGITIAVFCVLPLLVSDFSYARGSFHNFKIEPGQRSSTSEFIVRFADSKVNTLEAANKILKREGFQALRILTQNMNVFLVGVPSGKTAEQVAEKFNSDSRFLYAQLDHVLERRGVRPNDGDFKRLWGLKDQKAGIGAEEAWSLGTGGKDVAGDDIVVAVIDGGLAVGHEDIRENLWKNRNEIPGNGRDDDRNGYIDDVHGWNAFFGDNFIPNEEHGTHVSGIIGARGNNKKGVSGVNWKVKVMPVVATSAFSFYRTSVVVAAYHYIIAQKKLWLKTNGRKGANIVATNSSFGHDEEDCTKDEYPIWNDLFNEMGKLGIISVVATANNDVDVDTTGDVPSGCSSKYLVAVTNTNSRNKLEEYSGWGAKNIDLGAPGTDILSTVPKDAYDLMSGTSMATPHVAGAAALLHNVATWDFYELYRSNPSEAVLLLKDILIAGVDPLKDLAGKTVSGGRLNLYNSALMISQYNLSEMYDILDEISAPADLGEILFQWPSDESRGVRRPRVDHGQI